MPLLYFWRGDNYRRDLDMGAGYNLNQANPLLHSIDNGDSLWAFTRNTVGDYVLAAELVVSAKTLNPPTFRYGRYRLWGNLVASRYFSVEGQPSAEALIRGLSCCPQAVVLGRSFQGRSAVRRLTQEDHRLLRSYAAALSLEPRSRLIPEDQLEQTLEGATVEQVRRLVDDSPNGLARKRREYLYTRAPTRSRKHAADLHSLYAGRCQICLWDPWEKYGSQLCQAHHIHWLSRGGEDRMHNMALVCPNHHAAIHKCDAPFDYDDMAFVFPRYRGLLQLNRHLRAN
jgi:5-methylcytosine-specific restriction protein A